MPSATRPLKRCRHGEKPWRLRDHVERHEADIVPLPRHAGLRIAEADPQQHARLGLLLLGGLWPGLGRPWRGSAPLAPAALPAPAPPLAGRGAAGGGGSATGFGDLGRRRDGRDHEVAVR
jgi:hypothetical protein